MGSIYSSYFSAENPNAATVGTYTWKTSKWDCSSLASVTLLFSFSLALEAMTEMAMGLLCCQSKIEMFVVVSEDGVIRCLVGVSMCINVQPKATYSSGLKFCKPALTADT